MGRASILNRRRSLVERSASPRYPAALTAACALPARDAPPRPLLALLRQTTMTRGGPLAGVNRTSRGYRRRSDLTPTRSSGEGHPVTPHPQLGIGRAGNSLFYSDRFRPACKTHRPLYGRLNVR